MRLWFKNKHGQKPKTFQYWGFFETQIGSSNDRNPLILCQSLKELPLVVAGSWTVDKNGRECRVPWVYPSRPRQRRPASVSDMDPLRGQRPFVTRRPLTLRSRRRWPSAGPRSRALWSHPSRPRRRGACFVQTRCRTRRGSCTGAADGKRGPRASTGLSPETLRTATPCDKTGVR